ncbi:hypothetical protein BT69DRAFT_1297066 [Atractiella rhizophila]|nr:hypothetical protein BT69DRAFT_1297066 [Atractiella rhizophila]
MFFTWTCEQSAGSEEGAEEGNDHQDEENQFKPRKKPTGFLLIVKNQKTRRGVPVVFMMTTSEEHYPVMLWLSFFFNRVLIDCSDTEALVITTVAPWVTILYCLWHLLRALTNQGDRKISAGKHEADENLANQRKKNKSLREAAVQDFIAVMNMEEEEEFERRWHEMIALWSTRSIPWVNYLRSEWYGHKTRWGKPWRRTQTYHITTNNYIESYHRNIKINYV